MKDSTTIKVSKDIVNQFKILAVKLDKPRNVLIDNALLEYLEKVKEE